MKVFLIGATGYIGGDALHILNETKNSEFDISCLVRDSKKADSVRSAYPRIRIVEGDLDDSQLIQEEASNADLVLNLGSTSHSSSAHAIVKGLASKGRSGGTVQIAGATVVSGKDIAEGRYGEAPEAIYHDGKDSDKVIELIKANQKRAVENLVVSQDPSMVKTALCVCPLIYGQGRGPVHQRSIQAPEIARCTLERKHGFVFGKGENVWSNIHVHDLSDQVFKLLKAAKQAREGLWNDKGIYLIENGQMPFLELYSGIAKEAHSQGLIDSPNPQETIDADTANSLSGHAAVLWGTNAVIKSSRSQDLLDWSPSGPSLQEELPAIVKDEAGKQ
ncbi:hypothetical protein C1H76_0635 [Elsinoe australis]|uniref:NmrA-like domain-containing protein n=1 Tax=Elsinoe australis TaxID=40998 RepID=A0A4U7B6P3_9PEZI|nr:hypothetical protein C1H76_0635 [Elsinoe australis]